MKKMIPTTVTLLTLFITSFYLMSCEKIAPETMCTCEQQKSTEAKTWLTATPWLIEEVIDPLMGTRYKRGITSDSKNFSAARYHYQENNSLTGIDWFGNNMEQTCYTLLDNDRKIKLSSPICGSIEDIIIINATQFIYRSVDGSIFKLVPISSTETATKK